MKNRITDYAATIVRIMFGVIMLAHAYDKWTHLDSNHMGFEKFLQLPAYFVEVTATIETVSGILLIFGLFTRFAGILVSILMIGAIASYRWKLGLLGNPSANTGGYELNLVFLGLGIMLSCYGATRLSADVLFNLRKTKHRAVSN